MPGRDQNFDQGLHKGKGEDSTEIMGQIDTSIVTMGNKENRKRLVQGSWTKYRPVLRSWAR